MEKLKNILKYILDVLRPEKRIEQPIAAFKTKSYVLGFAFDAQRETVILIEKNRPAWQKGKLNGVGGKIDPEDLTEYHAMAREFKEETGVETSPDEWEKFAIMNCDNDIMGGHSIVYCFRLFSDKIIKCSTQETERVLREEIVENHLFTMKPLIGKVNYLIPMALADDITLVEFTMNK